MARTYPKSPVAPASSRCMTGFGIGSTTTCDGRKVKAGSSESAEEGP